MTKHNDVAVPSSVQPPTFDWQQRLCPLFSAADMVGFSMRGPQRIVRPNGAQEQSANFAPTPCQGHHCMLFVDMPGNDGVCHGDGACALALGAVVNAQRLELARAQAQPQARIEPVSPSAVPAPPASPNIT